MEAQLQLIPSPDGSADHSGTAEWKLDADTRARGRAGIALARQALQQARRGGVPRAATEQVRHSTAA